jgi:hypothetical protein
MKKVLHQRGSVSPRTLYKGRRFAGGVADPVHQGCLPTSKVRDTRVMAGDGKAYRDGQTLLRHNGCTIDCVWAAAKTSSDSFLKAVCIFAEVVKKPRAFRHLLKVGVGWRGAQG